MSQPEAPADGATLPVTPSAGGSVGLAMVVVAVMAGAVDVAVDPDGFDIGAADVPAAAAVEAALDGALVVEDVVDELLAVVLLVDPRPASGSSA